MIIRERVYLCITQLYIKYLFLNFRYSVFCNPIMAENVHEIYIFIVKGHEMKSQLSQLWF